MMTPILPFLLLQTLPSVTLAGKPAPIVFVIQSQPGDFHTSLAEKSQKSILAQWNKYVPDHVMDPPHIVLSHHLKEGLAESAWTVFPLIEVFASHMLAEDTIEWAAVLGDSTQVDLRNLNLAVEKYRFNPTDSPLFLGRSAQDSQSTIVHHFDSPTGLTFPDTEAGIFLSRKLVLDLHREMSDLDTKVSDSVRKLYPKDFNIDPAYEFAKYLYRNGEGVSLQNLEEICAQKSSQHKCFTTARPQVTSCLKSSQTAEMQAVLGRSLVTVKTCSQYHADRVRVVQETWAPLLPHLEYISDKEDPTLPTLALPYTVNTVTGHCNKTLAILQHFLLQEERQMLVIVDDDTVLSVARLAALLACYIGEAGPILLGQRYGYGMATGSGYNYITGGGGIILNRAAAKILAPCSCPMEDSPDDMHLGMCARRAGVPVLHSSRMFQARPPDYPSSILSYRKPVSFHKHWEIDPVQVYTDYFEKADSRLKDTVKDEL